MHQRKSKKILLYFFLLFFFGSIQNIEFNNINFDKIEEINISGLEHEEQLSILNKINKLDLSSIFFLNKKEFNKVINSNSLVESFEIFKKYPSSLKIKIQKTIFLAKINKNKKIYLVGSNGKLSNYNYSNEKLPFIFGKPDLHEFLKFKSLIDKSKIQYSDIQRLFYFPSKRWDIEINNNILLKLPNKNITNSLNSIFEILNDNKSNNIKIVDARIKNQIILND